MAMERLARRQSLETLLSGSLLVFLGLAARMAILFATEVLAARYLGPTDYGLLTWALVVLGIGSMLSTLGMSTAARRFIPLFVQSGDTASLRGSLILLITVAGAGGLLGMAILLLGAGQLSLKVFGDARQLPVLTALVFALPFWNLQKVLLGFAAGFKRPMIKVSTEDLFLSMGFLAVVVGAMAMGYRAFGIALGYAIVYIASAGVAAVMIRFRTPAASMPKVAPRLRVREILGFSWPLVFTETLGKTTGIIDILMVGIFALAVDVGTYRVASDLAIVMSFVLMSFGFLYLPIASEYFARGDLPGWRLFNARVTRWTMLMAFPVFAVLFFRPGEVLSTFYGPEFAGAVQVLRVLAVAYFIHAALGFTGLNLVVAGHTRWQMVARVAAVCVSIVGHAIFIPLYGIVGAAYVTLASVVTAKGLNLAASTVCLGIHPFTRSHGKALLTVLSCAVLVHYVTAPFSGNGVVTLVTYAVSLALLLVLFLKSEMLFDGDDRELFTGVLRAGARSSV